MYQAKVGLLARVNHYIKACVEDGKIADLTGYFCPLCMGAIVGHEDMIDSRILAPVQWETGS